MDEKVVGVVTWKASEGENLNFAVPSKLVTTLLTNSTVRPLGSVSVPDSTSAPTSTVERVWTSMTTAHDYKVRMDGDYIYVQRINLPVALQSTAAFQRAELKKAGNKWSGITHAYAPYSNKNSTKWCKTETEVEIDVVTESRIEGKSQVAPTVNLKACEPEHLEWKPFTWIPK